MRSTEPTVWLTVACTVVAFSGVSGGCGDSPMGASSDSGVDATDDALVDAEQTTAIDRSELTDVGTDQPLDYADPRLWLCRPGNDPDECDRPLDATELLPDGSMQVAAHEKAADPGFDCFYVYPTVKLDSDEPMTDFANIDITLDPLLAQGARFSRVCRMFAPLYRQDGVVPGAGGQPTPGERDFDLAAGDVTDAFTYYLDHLSEGRKFVLIGHSQGTAMLTNLVAEEIDTNPDLRERMLSALLIGGGVTVPTDETVGGMFENVPLCTEPGQTGCVIAYVSYSEETPPTASSMFGSSMDPNMQAACTEPAHLAGRSGENYMGSYIAMERVNATFMADGFELLPEVDTPFIVYRDVLRGECKSEGGISYLEVSLHMDEGDARPPPAYHSSFLESALGLHLVDYNLPLDDLIEAVSLQAQAAGVE